MLIQHILTEQIFRDLFPLSAFHRENHLARALAGVEQAFLRGETRHNLLRRMEPYYAAIRRAAANAIAATEKQEFLKAVYEDFYTAYNPKDADRMGIVYTPAEVVRFIIQGCDTLARAHFGRGLADEGLDILDPCTGTGQGERGTRIKPRLKADKTAGRIDIDELTVLHEVPPEAWDYRLGHRSALEWILEEYKESTPRDPTIREKFNTYRFADHKEKVIDLLMRVCWVSVETMQIIAAMRGAQR